MEGVRVKEERMDEEEEEGEVPSPPELSDEAGPSSAAAPTLPASIPVFPERVRVKEEPIDPAERGQGQEVNGYPLVQRNREKRKKKHKHKDKDRERRGEKRRREEDGEEEEPPPVIRIKQERDIFEPEDGDMEVEPPPASTSAAASVPEEGGAATSNEPPPPPPQENGTATPADGPTPLANFLNFGSAPVPNPELSIVERLAQEKRLAALAPKPQRFAHYNAHDEAGETKYVADQPLRNQPINQRQDDEDLSEDEQYDGYSESVLQDHGSEGPKDKKLLVYSKYNFKERNVDSSRLAVYAQKEKILKAIENHRVVIVDGFTGCGKTTQVPQFILDRHCERQKPCNIVVTQPRKIAAISVARRVCDERNWKVGQVVGYQVGMDSKRDQDDTILTYMTTGVLLQKLIGSRHFGNITHIIIDEVHERDLESDLLLLVIKKILLDDKEKKQSHVKFVLMSATLNAKKFSKYFPVQTGIAEVEESPVIKIPHHFHHTVDELFLDSILSDNRELLDTLEGTLNMEKATIPEEMYTVAVDCIVSMDDYDRRLELDPRMKRKGTKLEKRGSVLVFLPGMEEINRLYRSLTAKNHMDLQEALEKDRNYRGDDFHQWDIVPLHSTITSDEQQRVFERPRSYHRKIILSTNIAESSVTVPDVHYVIDFCLTKSLCIDPYTNFTTLRMVWASVSQCIQRKGRTGRVCDGKVFRLVTKQFFSQLPQDTKPEMLRSNLETVVLQLKKLNLGTPKELLAMALDAPLVSGIERAVANLKELGAITILKTVPNSQGVRVYDTCDGDLTFLGRIMTDLPIPQQCARLIMLGYCFGVMKEAIIIAAALSVKNPFSTPFKRTLDAYLSRLSWSKKTGSDLFALFYVYKHWVKQFGDSNGDNNEQDDGRRTRTTFNERQWARGAFVQLSVLREIKSTVDLIEERLARHKLAINPLHTDVETPQGELTKDATFMLKLAIAGAFYPNYFHRRRPDVKTYERDKSREISGLDLFNTIYFKGFPAGHDGKVYAKYVADYLSFGLTVPSIKFDGQKVLATFDNRGEKIGPISKGLYRAIKMRQIRETLEFPLASRDKEKDILKDWDKKLERRKFNRCPPQCALPGVDLSKIYVRITHIENPGQFWINYSFHTRKLDEIVNHINEELVHVPINPNKIVPNALCLAKFQDRYYRAKILLTVPRPIDDSLVFFVDYGNTAWVKNSTIEDFSSSMIEKGYANIPCLAVECRLSNIKPATIHGSGWHDSAKREFEMFAENAPFVYIDIYSVSKSVISGRLIGHDERRVEQNFNDRLISLAYAELCDEPTFSQLNHVARTRVSLQDQDERAAHNNEQIGEQLDFDFVQPDLDPRRCTKTLLKGPWSPLELDFQSLCHSSNTKQVKVDNNSVNSVVLDTEPTAPISRLMVSAYVGIQDRSGSVVARDTTIMPSVPGMLAIMAMLFTPTMELRIDIRQTRYTGVLCGLGTAPDAEDPDQPIYPDHDVEIVFDTVLDDDDIDSINTIRFLMNLILRRQGRNASIINIPHYQSAVKAEILKLLQRVRKPVDEEVWPQEEYAWNRVESASLIPPPRQRYQREPQDIFGPLFKVRLREDGPTSWNWGYGV